MRSNSKEGLITVDRACAHKSSVTCSECRLNQICLPIALTTSEMSVLDESVQRGQPKEKGHYLYRMGDKFTALYAVRSGSFKAYTVLDNGVEQVTGFYLPGDVMGVDGIARQQHTNNLVSLEHASICKIPFSRLEELSSSIPTLQNNLFRMMGSEITREQEMMTLLGSCSAEQKLASFILSLSQRRAERNLSEEVLELSMSRTDIANYLGLTIETVSRTISHLKKKKTVDVSNKHITILDMSALKLVVSGS